MATAGFPAQQKPGGTAYVIGEGGLLDALHAMAIPSSITIQITSWWAKAAH